MTLYFEPWQLVAVCLLTVIGAAVVALIVVGLLGAWLLRDSGSVPVAKSAAKPEPVADVVPLRDAHHDPLTCRECLGADRGGF